MGTLHQLDSSKTINTQNSESLVRGLCYDKQLQCASVVMTKVVSEICEKHKLGPLQSMILGRALVAASLLGANGKVSGETVQLALNGDGPLKQVVAEYIFPGNLRGFTSQLNLESPIKTFGELLGQGTLSVKRVLHGSAEPYVGLSKLVNGEVGEDVAKYLLESEQIPSSISVGVEIDKDTGKILAAGGVLIQKVAGTDLDAAVVDSFNEKITASGGVLCQIKAGKSSLEIFKSVAAASGDTENDEISEIALKAHCPCEKSRFKKAMSSLPYEELVAAHKEHGSLEAVCQYCGAAYEFDLMEFQS